VYPLLKEKYDLSFIQIGSITFAFQLCASILQPIIGHYIDKKPKVYAQLYGVIGSILGILFLAFANSFTTIILSCLLIGIGSAIFHPESSRIVNLTSRGKIGLAQSIFQVGGNLGTAISPVLVAYIVLPNQQEAIVVFIIPLIIGLFVFREVASWYKKYLSSSMSKKQNFQLTTTFSRKKIKYILGVLLVILFSKFIYAASLSNYYTFYLIEKFNLTIEQSQFHLFIYLFSYMLGTIFGGPLGDKFGRLYVIWFSVLEAVPFILLLPFASLFYTDVLIILIGLIMASAFPAILSYAQELLPKKLGVISGLFYGFAFGVAAIGSAFIGVLAEYTSIYLVYKFCSFLPLIGVVCFLLPNLKVK
jgi:FSR family fosmidomycin resistance protein-like MFS transporter